MSNVGPVCHIPPDGTPANPQPHNIPGMPQAINPRSPTFNNDVANMLNAFRQMLMQLLGQLHALDQKTNGIINGFQTKKDNNGDWKQLEQVTEKVKIYQNNDETSPNWVEVERTNKLVMQDKATGKKWQWNRHG